MVVRIIGGRKGYEGREKMARGNGGGRQTKADVVAGRRKIDCGKKIAGGRNKSAARGGDREGKDIRGRKWERIGVEGRLG